jgi:NAD(P)-dependent dehydrogenase (short-subunit alcohol dehydrogenase family)
MSNKNVLITGGTKGIGFGIAEVLLSHNYNVVITGRNQQGVDEAVSLLGKISGTGKILGYACDVTDLQSMTEMMDKIHQQLGKTEVVIANAGIGHFGSVEDLTADQWKETMDVNLTGVFNTVKASLEDVKEKQGYIITIASLAGTNFFAGGSAYNASKFGLVGFSQAIMLDLRKYGVKVTTIMPGSVTSHFNNHVPNEGDDWKIQPEDIGQMVLDLLNMNPRTLPSKIEVRPTLPK